MTHDTKRPDLLVPDHKLVTGDRAKRDLDRTRKYDERGKRIAPPADYMQDTMTRQEAMDHLGEAVAVAVRKAYEEMDDAIGERLEWMERVIYENVLRQIERRTWRYRLNMWLRAYLTDVGLLTPVQIARSVDPVEALDPNVQAAAKATETLRWREFPGWNDDAKAWMESGGVILVPTPRKKGSDEAARLAAGTTDILRRAIAMIVEEKDVPELKDGVMVLRLDEELYEAARQQVQQREIP